MGELRKREEEERKSSITLIVKIERFRNKKIDVEERERGETE